jgi:5-methylthioribose kinase
MYVAPDDVAVHATDRVPSLGTVQQVDRLTKGRLNFVWRVTGARESVIVKVMAPFAASYPSISLDRRRVEVEASALEILSPGGALSDVGSGAVEVPRLLDHDRDRDILIIEDLGLRPDIGTWIETDADLDRAFDMGRRIGGFVGRLHRESTNVADIKSQVMNKQIQRTRLDNQYRAVEGLARSVGIADAKQLGGVAVALGQELCRPGCVFIMGDLWQHSVLVSKHRLWIIDWELAHWGRPGQDVGHFVAHLWMLKHRAHDVRLEAAYRRLRDGFLVGYDEALGRRFGELFGSSGLEQSRIHAGAEILVRTVGGFKSGYIYDGLDADDAAVKEAVETAASLIRGSPETDLFGGLDR